ncbi:hypothetical protein M758_9G001500 [Ceratodon purpureus]|uniref:Uncharacterized protein n=1 Tax=Ceratodon purpureus TaxID=3225 RepID=A0A8T0GNX7_CERPU|nr:hypothetical protein KC19_9G001500 [Ceratodon purpureus]KAG0604702.1 hypothetical protein M758_9G001500 [Ceratodon purpureus]
MSIRHKSMPRQYMVRVTERKTRCIVICELSSATNPKQIKEKSTCKSTLCPYLTCRQKATGCPIFHTSVNCINFKLQPELTRTQVHSYAQRQANTYRATQII